MKTLYLLRHAKSSWGDPGLSDFDRPLNARGTRAAPIMAAYMRGKRFRPDVVLCSTARRAEETWRLVAPTLGGEPEVRFLKSLYMAPPSVLLDSLRRLPDSYDGALVVGHNPGLEELAVSLSADGNKAALEQLQIKFPTAALAVITMDGGWEDFASGSGFLQEVTLPKKL